MGCVVNLDPLPGCYVDIFEFSEVWGLLNLSHGEENPQIRYHLFFTMPKTL